MPFDPAAADAFADSFARDSAFEQLLRLAASYSSRQSASQQGGSRSSARRSPLTEDIERRAYELYLGRGGTHGCDMDDWLQAERQVLEELKIKESQLASGPRLWSFESAPRIALSQAQRSLSTALRAFKSLFAFLISGIDSGKQQR